VEEGRRVGGMEEDEQSVHGLEVGYRGKRGFYRSRRASLRGSRLVRR
jgi:hypothetical protein